MKNGLISIFFVAFIPTSFTNPPAVSIDEQLVTQNVFIITIDGFRWQEIFSGADSVLINDTIYTPDGATIKAMYWDDTAEKRRKKLMPFFWNVIASRGQIYGNRNFGNCMNVANSYAISYPGYNEMLTGINDPTISSNRKINNPNISVLEFLDSQQDFAGKIALFSSWDVFPYILNEERNQLFINSGYKRAKEQVDSESVLKSVENNIQFKTATRYDELTFINAKEYIRKNEPRIVYIGLGETDEFAHEGRYDLYLDQAAKVDRMIGELWHIVQTTAHYKNKTTFIITTDHGRGSKTSKWTSHGSFIRGSSQTWLAVAGPAIKPLGEVKQVLQLYQQQIAQTIAHTAGKEFGGEGVAQAISLK